MKNTAALILIVVFYAVPIKGEWVQTSLNGGFAYYVAATDKTMFATTNKGGLFRSDINNVEWVYVLGAGYEIRSIQVTGDSVFAAGENGVHLSTDEGKSWRIIDGSDIRSYFRSANMICCTFEFPGGRFSTDNGQTWTSLDIEKKVIEHICAAGPDRIFAAVQFVRGFFKSNDRGVTWKEVDIPPPISEVQDFFVKDDIVIAAMGGACCISLDRGDTWNRIGDLEGMSIGSIAYSPSGFFFALTFNRGVFRSSDNGATWTHVGDTIDNAFSIEANGNGTLFATVNAERSVLRSSDNGESWVPVSGGLRCDDDVVVTANSRGEVLAGGDWGIFKSSDHGQAWIDVDSALQRKDHLLVRDFAVLDSEMYAVAGNVHGVLRSVDHGNRWDSVSSYSLSEKFNPLQICITDSGHLIVSTIADGVIMSKDRGTTWGQISSICYADGIYTNKNDILIAHYSADYNSGYTGKLFRYKGAGTQWDTIGAWPAAIDEVLSYGGSLFVATSSALSGGLYRSGDNGANWIKIDSSKVAASINTLVSYDSLLFTGTDFHGIFMSNDNGETWIDVNGALKNRWVLSERYSNLWIYSLALANGNLYASIAGGSVWCRPIDEIAALLPVKKEAARSADVDNLRVTGPRDRFVKNVRIQLSHPQKVSVRIYGLDGKLKTTLVDKFLPEGKHDLVWNMSRLSSGSYVVKMVAGNKSFFKLVNNCVAAF